MGERKQGPGKLGFAAVFDGHLTVGEMRELYFESQSEMQGTWTVQQMGEVEAILMTFCGRVAEIVRVTVQYAKYTKF